MNYREFRESFGSTEALSRDVALKEFNNLRELGLKAVMGAVGNTTCRLVWLEIGYKIRSTDIIAPFFYCYDEEGENALRGVGVWREIT